MPASSTIVACQKRNETNCPVVETDNESAVEVLYCTVFAPEDFEHNMADDISSTFF